MKFKTRQIKDPFALEQDEWIFKGMITKYGKKWAKKQLRRKREFTFERILLMVALFLFLVGVMYSMSAVNKIKDIQEEHIMKPISVDISEYNCPPNLTDYQCETFIRFALVNNIDVQDFLLDRFNKSL